MKPPLAGRLNEARSNKVLVPDEHERLVVSLYEAHSGHEDSDGFAVC